MKTKLKKEKADDLRADEVSVSAMTGQLLEVGGILHSFVQSLNTSGFREYVDYIGRPWYGFFYNLFIGIARGFGFVLGATVVVALFVYVLSVFLVQLPFVGEFFQFIQKVITDPELRQGLQSGQVGQGLSEMFDQFKANVLR